MPSIMQSRWHVGTWGGRTIHLQLGSRGGVLRWGGLHTGGGQVTNRVLRWGGLHTGEGQVTDGVLRWEGLHTGEGQVADRCGMDGKGCTLAGARWLWLVSGYDDGEGCTLTSVR